MKKDKNLLDKLMKAVRDRSYENPAEDYKRNLRKYVFSSCLLKLCDKPLPDNKKYCRLTFKEKTTDKWYKPHEQVLYYTNASNLNPKDVGLKEEYWSKIYPSPQVVCHNDLRREYYSHTDSLELIVNILYEKHYELLVESLNKMETSVATAQKRSKEGKARAKTKSAVTFTKKEQIDIAKRIYEEVLDNELRKVESNIGKLFKCKFKFDYTNLTTSSSNYIIALANSNAETDLSGQGLLDEIKETNINVDELLNKWIDDKDPLFRRFALTFADSKLTLGLLDNDETVRLNAELRISGRSKGII